MKTFLQLLRVAISVAFATLVGVVILTWCIGAVEAREYPGECILYCLAVNALAIAWVGSENCLEKIFWSAFYHALTMIVVYVTVARSVLTVVPWPDAVASLWLPLRVGAAMGVGSSLCYLFLGRIGRSFPLGARRA
ncbi:MAG: hypothetical protein K2W82_17120 [Candidatus Obscuribacterales bacterium]|nr:hypothetical protein [Candidatus Obscuribacterales bacterium]